MKDADHIGQGHVVIGYQALHLVKFSQVSIVQSFIAKYEIDTIEIKIKYVSSPLSAPKVFCGCKFFLLREFVEHFGRDCGRVCPEYVFHRFVFAPLVAISAGSEPAVLVRFPNALQVIQWRVVLR